MAKPTKAAKAEARAKSPWATGLATALGSSFVFGPLVGAGLGLTQGILAKRLRDSELEKSAAESETVSALDASIQEQIGSAGQFADTDIDQEQLKNWNTRRANLAKLAAHPDEKVRAKAAQDLADLSTGIGSFLEDVEGRRENVEDTRLSLQRAAVQDVAKQFRSGYEGAIKKRRELQASAGQIHTLLNDESFDVNKPINRGRLIDLMRSNSRTILADTADFGSALQSAGGGQGLIGSVLGLLGGAMKADDFKFTKEEWRAIASAMYDAETKQFSGEMQRIEAGVADLEFAAHDLGILPADYGLAQYVLGQEEEFPRALKGKGGYRETPGMVGPWRSGAGPSDAPRTSSGGVVNDWLTELENRMRARNRDNNTRRPTN